MDAKNKYCEWSPTEEEFRYLLPDRLERIKGALCDRDTAGTREQGEESIVRGFHIRRFPGSVGRGPQVEATPNPRGNGREEAVGFSGNGGRGKGGKMMF